MNKNTPIFAVGDHVAFSQRRTKMNTNTDSTEDIRRIMQAQINSEQAAREALEAKHGRVWNTQELSTDFKVTGFMAPFVVVKRKDTGEVGSLMFQHSPRFYFGWQAD